MAEEIRLLGIGKEEDYAQCMIEKDELINLIEWILQFKPYADGLRQVFTEDEAAE